MVDLLLSITHGWRANNNDAIVKLSISLSLAHTLATTLRAAGVVSVKLRAAGRRRIGSGRVEVRGQSFADHDHLANCLVTPIVDCRPIGSTIA